MKYELIKKKKFIIVGRLSVIHLWTARTPMNRLPALPPVGQPWANRAPTLGQPWSNPGPTVGQPWSNPGPTLGQPWATGLLPSGTRANDQWSGLFCNTSRLAVHSHLIGGLPTTNLLLCAVTALLYCNNSRPNHCLSWELWTGKARFVYQSH